MSMPQSPPRPPIAANFNGGRLAFDRAALLDALQRLPAEAPVVVLIHGYRFHPGRLFYCPHHHIFSLDPPPKDAMAISWPRHLGLDGNEGLAIALGWPAVGNLWKAYRRAAQTGIALADFAEAFAQIAPGRALNIVAHSFGTRVALTALLRAKPGQFDRLILLSGAETRSLARRAMASPAGQQVSILNVTSRENDLFDAAFEWLLHGGRHWSIGQGMGLPLANWRDLWIDNQRTLDALAAMGFSLTAPLGRISHWSPYLRPGVFSLYRAFLQSQISLVDLAPSKPARRWSLLLGLFGKRLARAAPASVQAMP